MITCGSEKWQINASYLRFLFKFECSLRVLVFREYCHFSEPPPVTSKLKMTTIIRNRTLEISVAGLTVVLLALTIMTYFLDQNKSNWICGPVLFLMELVALGLQTVLTVLIWKATSKKTKFVLLSLSILMIGFTTYGFVNFNLNCT